MCSETRARSAHAVHVEFMEPRAVLELFRRPEVGVLGNDVDGKLERVMAAL